MKVHLIVGARPNFMKAAPIIAAAQQHKEKISCYLIHTGQHYDAVMSKLFFEDLGLPKPDIYLGVGSGTHAEQTARVMVELERIFVSKKPDLVMVVGDVNSTMAGALAASKLCIPVAHIEAGLRSFDREMPEEINRLVTDVLADILWTPSQDAVDNLIREGIPPGKIQTVGNIMIDSLEMLREKIEKQEVYRSFGLQAKGYGVVTLHRPSNVDDPATLRSLCGVLSDVAETVPIVFPVHPRTRKRMEESHLLPAGATNGRLHLPEPINYIRFMNLVFHCAFVVTDSGGIQEETSYLGIPCLTVRENTERPITITHGTNQLCALDDVKRETKEILEGRVRKPRAIPFWDGRTAERIVYVLKERYRMSGEHNPGKGGH